MIHLNNLYQLSPQVRYRIIESEAVAIHLEAGEVTVLNEIGARILDLLDGHRRLTDIVDLILAEYEVDQPQLERDVRHYIEELEEAEIVQSTGKVP